MDLKSHPFLRLDRSPSAHDGATLIALVRERAAHDPDAVAIVDGACELGYEATVASVDRVAAGLRDAGIGAGDVVAVCAERSAAAIVAMLAVMATRAAYLPLDPGLPTARLTTMCEIARARMVVASEPNVDRIATVPQVALDDLMSESLLLAVDANASAPRGDDVAYVVFTSGSTGTPKGIAVPHRALANVAAATRDALGIVAADRWLFRSSIGFDVAFGELATPLAAGAAIVVAPDAIGADPQALLELAHASAVTALFVVPTLLRALVELPRFDAGTLRIVTCAGEALGAALQRRFFERSRAQLWNLYGPSETTVWVTMHRCDPAIAVAADASVPLGRAIRNTTVSIRDESLAPLPAGVPGEIVVNGVALADGYLDLPDETAARFPLDRADPASGRCYRTGDVGRLRPDGLIEYLGRRDDQVKIRGVRIEPLEVVAALEALPGVRQAAVVARARHQDDERSDAVLVAFVVPAPNGAAFDERALRHELAAKLPRAMVPSTIRALEALPITPNGKIDAKRLRAYPLDDERLGTAPAATLSPSETERRLLAIWHELLGPATIGVDDEFFEVGGDSLLSLVMLERVERELERAVEPAAFHARPTVAALARLLRRGDAAATIRGAVRLNASGTRAPLVLLHGDFAGGAYARRLASLLGDDRPLTAFAPHGADGTFVPRSVEEMADDYVARIARFHPGGPLRVAGYSAAGVVALEVARRLAAHGRDVDRVIVIGGEPMNVAHAWAKRLVRRAGVSPMHVRRAVARLRGSTEYAAVPNPDAASVVDRAPFRAYLEATMDFIPTPFAGHVHLVWPSEQAPTQPRDPRDLWRALARDVTIAYAPGDHHTAITQHLATIGEAIATELATER